MSAHADPITRQQVIKILRQLIAGELTPQAASAWASPWLDKFDRIADVKTRQGLERLGMAELPSTDREYLYGKEDFEDWIRELETGSQR